MFSRTVALGLILSLALRADQPDQTAQDEQRLGQADLKTDAASLLDFFRRQTVRVDQAEIKTLVGQLSHRSFSVRQKATRKLRDLGARAVPLLKEAAADADLEVRRKAEALLQEIVNGAKPDVVAAAGRLLALRKPDGAAEALLDFLPAVLEETTVRELHFCLARLTLKGGKPDAAVLKALTDEAPVRRAAAGVALCTAAGKDNLDELRPLLRDADATVRLHVGLALLAHGEKEVVPVLAGVFAKLPRNQLWRAEDVLYQLAGEHAPNAVFDDSPQGRKDFVDAWLAWWKKRGDQLDVVDLLKQRRRDWTLIVLLDDDVVLELDAKDKERFRIEKVRFPLDAQTLTGDRVLVAEHGASRVAERLRDGTVLWEVKAVEPLVAQRLDNGNTFIATRGGLTEVDREGKEVFAWNPTDGEQVMRAKKLTDGTYAVILNSPQRAYLRIDRHGNPVGGPGLNVSVQTFGGRVDVQDNGNVLIPQMASDKVTEFDARGKTVREFNVREPIVATRLPNGNTIITSMSDKKAVELDPKGTQVWEYQGNTRVTRAYRR